uniref:G-protein coupled receptors family 1 profile domain-containing protein n=1 Tax=Romanomermis culicivorax TaxID=13658 RepID=A0A915I7J0_ROMCU
MAQQEWPDSEPVDWEKYQSPGIMSESNQTIANCTYLKFTALMRKQSHSLDGYFLAPIYIFGSMGGILNFIVLLKMKSHCVWPLVAMALSDTLYFNASFIYESYRFETLANNDRFSNFYAKCYPTIYLLVRWFSLTSFW